MPKVTFIVDYTPQGHAADRPAYKKGETYDLHVSYAEKYKARGLAVDFDPKAERERQQQQERAETERRAAEEAAALAVEHDRKLQTDADRKAADEAAAPAAERELPSDDQVKNRDTTQKGINAEQPRRNPRGRQG